jgi:acyl-CoA thioesterase FadM
MISTEHIINDTPLVIRRRVKWGECDPARVVYTVTFSEYVISAAELFYGSVFGTTPQVAKDKFGFGTPTRALTFDFRSSLRRIRHDGDRRRRPLAHLCPAHFRPYARR